MAAKKSVEKNEGILPPPSSSSMDDDDEMSSDVKIIKTVGGECCNTKPALRSSRVQRKKKEKSSVNCDECHMCEEGGSKFFLIIRNACQTTFTNLISIPLSSLLFIFQCWCVVTTATRLSI